MAKQNAKVFKTYSAALAAADGRPLVRVGPVYVVLDGDLIDLNLTEVAVITSRGIAGHVTLGHLARLGNANWAEPKEGYAGADPTFALAFRATPPQETTP